MLFKYSCKGKGFYFGWQKENNLNFLASFIQKGNLDNGTDTRRKYISPVELGSKSPKRVFVKIVTALHNTESLQDFHVTDT